MSEDRTPNYEVGYGKPPRANQFQAGRSGNPKGRPKAERNFIKLVENALQRTVTVQVGGKRRRMTQMEAMAEKVVLDALKGDPKARAQVLAMLEKKALVDNRPSAVLIVPSSPDPDDWERACAEYHDKQAAKAAEERRQAGR